jgi:transcriptional regulator with XRE-family HTH domain
MQNPLDSFAAALRAARIKRNLTQRELADKLHMSVRTIIEIERCKSSPKFETVATLARELNISLDAAVFQDVQACVIWMYERMAYGYEQYPGFFTLHSLGFMRDEKADGKRHMQQAWHHMLMGLCAVLKQDARIRPDAFDEQFTAEKFAEVLFSQLLSALLRQDYDPSAVLEVVRRTLY